MDEVAVTAVLIIITFILLYIYLVWWSSGIMCKNFRLKSRIPCLFASIFLAPLYWIFFIASFFFDPDLGDVEPHRESKKPRKRKKKSNKSKK